MSSISWERQTHIPIMTPWAERRKGLDRGRGGIVIAQRLSIHQRKVQKTREQGCGGKKRQLITERDGEDKPAEDKRSREGKVKS